MSRKNVMTHYTGIKMLESLRNFEYSASNPGITALDLQVLHFNYLLYALRNNNFTETLYYHWRPRQDNCAVQLPN